MANSTIVTLTRDGAWVQVSSNITTIKYLHAVKQFGRGAQLVGTLACDTVSPASNVTGRFVVPGDSVTEASIDLLGSSGKVYGRIYSGYGDMEIAVGT